LRYLYVFEKSVFAKLKNGGPLVSFAWHANSTLNWPILLHDYQKIRSCCWNFPLEGAKYFDMAFLKVHSAQHWNWRWL